MVRFTKRLITLLELVGPYSTLRSTTLTALLDQRKGPKGVLHKTKGHILHLNCKILGEGHVPPVPQFLSLLASKEIDFMILL